MNDTSTKPTIVGVSSAHIKPICHLAQAGCERQQPLGTCSKICHNALSGCNCCICKKWCKIAPKKSLYHGPKSSTFFVSLPTELNEEYTHPMRKFKLYIIMILLLVGLPLWAADEQEVVIDGEKPGTVLVYDGIDVSSYQKDIDWATTAKDPNIKFVYVKATEGATYTSRHYVQNMRNARKHGVKVGSYHFLRTGSRIRDQFENFIRAAKKQEQDLIPLIDVEVRNGWTNQQLRDSVKAFADLLEDYYGCKPMIYTSSSFFNNLLGIAFADYPLFIARYATTEPQINGAKWILWQFSEKGRIQGIDHHVDLCRFNKGCSLKDILYKPGASKRRHSVTQDVDRKDKPERVSVGEEQQVKETPKMSKRQERELKRKEEKERKARERAEQMAKDEAKKQAEADKRAKEKAAKQAAADKRAKEKAAKQAEADKRAKQEKEAKAKAAAERKAKAAKAKAEAKAQKQQQNKAKQTVQQQQKTNLMTTQRNDSVRAAKQKGRKINKSSADND